MAARRILKPKALPKRGTIGLISPASPLRDEAKLEAGIRYLESLGYRIELGANALNRSAYLAGSDEERLEDLEAMFANPKIDAIFCIRGGYGSMRYLQQINYKRIAKNPKIFVGFSDMTALNVALFNQCGLITFSGAMAAVDMPNFDPESEEQFWKILRSKRRVGTIKQSQTRECIEAGKAAGPLVCGNLSLLAALSGSPFAPRYKNAVLLMEDIGEESYKVDRLLCQLELAGSLKSAAALLFGHFTQDDTRKSSTAARPIPEVLRDYVQRNLNIGMMDMMYGHTAKKLTLPYGAHCIVDTAKGSFAIDEAVVV